MFGRCWRSVMWLSLRRRMWLVGAMALHFRMFGGHATSCVHYAVAGLTLRCEEVCFSFGHNCLYEYWLTTLGSLQRRQSTHRKLSASDRRNHASSFALTVCRASWHRQDSGPPSPRKEHTGLHVVVHFSRKKKMQEELNEPGRGLKSVDEFPSLPPVCKSRRPRRTKLCFDVSVPKLV